MRTRVAWSSNAERYLFALPPSRAEAIIVSVERYAETGHGFVRRLLDGSGERRLYGDGFYVVFELADQELRVLAIEPFG